MNGEDLDCTDLEDAYPGWHAWIGVGGDICYARRVRSSPPVVFRARTVTTLRDLIAAYLKDRP